MRNKPFKREVKQNLNFTNKILAIVFSYCYINETKINKTLKRIVTKNLKIPKQLLSIIFDYCCFEFKKSKVKFDKVKHYGKIISLVVMPNNKIVGQTSKYHTCVWDSNTGQLIQITKNNFGLLMAGVSIVGNFIRTDFNKMAMLKDNLIICVSGSIIFVIDVEKKDDCKTFLCCTFSNFSYYIDSFVVCDNMIFTRTNQQIIVWKLNIDAIKTINISHDINYSNKSELYYEYKIISVGEIHKWNIKDDMDINNLITTYVKNCNFYNNCTQYPHVDFTATITEYIKCGRFVYLDNNYIATGDCINKKYYITVYDIINESSKSLCVDEKINYMTTMNQKYIVVLIKNIIKIYDPSDFACVGIYRCASHDIENIICYNNIIVVVSNKHYIQIFST
jgi:hypothetical protein